MKQWVENEVLVCDPNVRSTEVDEAEDNLLRIVCTVHLDSTRYCMNGTVL